MQIYDDPKDPNELKDYEFDWSAQLGDGETVVSQVVTFVDAAGTTSPTETLTSPYSRVWLAGGTHASRAVYTIKIVTSGGRELEMAFGVNIVDSVLGPVALTDVERLTGELSELRAARHAFLTGGSVKQAWSGRYGNRMTYDNPTLSDFDNAIEACRRELEAATNAEAGHPRRRPIVPIWA